VRIGQLPCNWSTWQKHQPSLLVVLRLDWLFWRVHFIEVDHLLVMVSSALFRSYKTFLRADEMSGWPNNVAPLLLLHNKFYSIRKMDEFTRKWFSWNKILLTFTWFQKIVYCWCWIRVGIHETSFLRCSCIQNSKGWAITAKSNLKTLWLLL
jgi:hypothetical protein